MIEERQNNMKEQIDINPIHEPLIWLISRNNKIDFNKFSNIFSFTYYLSVIENTLNIFSAEITNKCETMIEELIYHVEARDLWREISKNRQNEDTPRKPPIYAAGYELRDRNIIRYLEEHPKMLNEYAREHGFTATELLDKIASLKDCY